MTFTTYFREYFKNQGFPDLKGQEAARLVDIISVESRLAGLLVNSHIKKGSDIEIYKARQELKRLTNSRTPAQLVSKWRGY